MFYLQQNINLMYYPSYHIYRISTFIINEHQQINNFLAALSQQNRCPSTEEMYMITCGIRAMIEQYEHMLLLEHLGNKYIHFYLWNQYDAKLRDQAYKDLGLKNTYENITIYHLTKKYLKSELKDPDFDTLCKLYKTTSCKIHAPFYNMPIIDLTVCYKMALKAYNIYMKYCCNQQNYINVLNQYQYSLC